MVGQHNKLSDLNQCLHLCSVSLGQRRVQEKLEGFATGANKYSLGFLLLIRGSPA
jgi:hypothetical protein